MKAVTRFAIYFSTCVCMHYTDSHVSPTLTAGRLGNGSEHDIVIPQQVQLPAKQKIESVVAGSDCTFLIASSGKVLACGNNEHNKLGLNSEIKGVAKRKAKVCSILASLGSNVNSVQGFS